MTSDCDTISSISQNFHYTATVTQATAAALKAGGDINCGPEYALLLNATAAGFVRQLMTTSSLDQFQFQFQFQFTDDLSGSESSRSGQQICPLRSARAYRTLIGARDPIRVPDSRLQVNENDIDVSVRRALRRRVQVGPPPIAR